MFTLQEQVIILNFRRNTKQILCVRNVMHKISLCQYHYEMGSLAMQNEKVNTFSNLGIYEDSISQPFLIEGQFKLFTKKPTKQQKPNPKNPMQY